MIDTTDEAAGANQIQIQDFKSSAIFIIQLFMTMMLLKGNTPQNKLIPTQTFVTNNSSHILLPRCSIGTSMFKVFQRLHLSLPCPTTPLTPGLGCLC